MIPTQPTPKPKRPPTQEELETLWDLMVESDRDRFTSNEHSLEAGRLVRGREKVDKSESKQPKLTVKLRSYPESNGKRNWTALLMRVEPWDGLIGNGGGITIARGELWNRVAYEAERAKVLIGERGTEPYILDFGDDIETPEQWAGEITGVTD